MPGNDFLEVHYPDSLAHMDYLLVAPSDLIQYQILTLGYSGCPNGWKKMTQPEHKTLRNTSTTTSLNISIETSMQKGILP